MGVEAVVDDLSHGHSIQVRSKNCDANLVGSVFHDSSDTGKTLDVELWHFELVDILVDVTFQRSRYWIVHFRIEQFFTWGIDWNVQYFLDLLMMLHFDLALAESGLV